MHVCMNACRHAWMGWDVYGWMVRTYACVHVHLYAGSPRSVARQAGRQPGRKVCRYVCGNVRML